MKSKVNIADMRSSPMCFDPITLEDVETGTAVNATELPEDWEGTIVELIQLPNYDHVDSIWATSWEGWLSDEEKELVADALLELEGDPALDLPRELVTLSIRSGVNVDKSYVGALAYSLKAGIPNAVLVETAVRVLEDS